MQPPISIETILQNRYRLVKILGQGGFGRTYLAEDQGRFNEPCALKEFIPNQSGAYALDKSKELFQREAAILYQIQHPQIPQFRATFEENQRLFLVQDYVEGKTYRELLNDRKATRSTFSEAEVLRLMQQLLPVLAHIHSKGIIHRDIAPDNIILRQRDQLPVLIDFGVVKEIATKVQAPETVPQQTTVGKLGYAPTEQMQTGRAYPSSDLYALAVTCLVLLTGREPQDLYDDRTLSWQWRHLVMVSSGLARILDKMLNNRPDDRYQSVSEVAQALQTMTNPAATNPAGTVPPTPAAPIAQANTPTVVPPTVNSQIPTVAIGRRPDPTPSGAQRLPPIVPTASTSVWDNPWSVFGIAAALAVVTFISSVAVVRALRNTTPSSPTVAVTPTPTLSIAASPTPTPTLTNRPVEYSQRLTLAPGDRLTPAGTLKANETLTYIIAGEQGQTLTAGLDGEGVLLTVLSPDHRPADNKAERVQQWQGNLNYGGDYYIQLRPVQGVTQSNYRLNVSLDASTPPTPTPPAAPAPSPTPQIAPQPLEIPSGQQSVSVTDRADALLIRRYLVNVQADQVLKAELLQGAVTISVRNPNGDLVEDASGITFWQAQVPTSGSYMIDVVATDSADFQLKVSVTGSTEAPQSPPQSP
jgi:serine/threonine protein kinase